MASETWDSQRLSHSIKISLCNSNDSHFCACKNKEHCNFWFVSALAAFFRTLTRSFVVLFASAKKIDIEKEGSNMKEEKRTFEEEKRRKKHEPWTMKEKKKNRTKNKKHKTKHNKHKTKNKKQKQKTENRKLKKIRKKNKTWKNKKKNKNEVELEVNQMMKKEGWKGAE